VTGDQVLALARDSGWRHVATSTRATEWRRDGVAARWALKGRAQAVLTRGGVVVARAGARGHLARLLGSPPEDLRPLEASDLASIGTLMRVDTPDGSVVDPRFPVREHMAADHDVHPLQAEAAEDPEALHRALHHADTYRGGAWVTPHIHAPLNDRRTP
jgi:hypothetical protein